MAKRYFGYTQAQVLQHLQEEYSQSKDFVDQKRTLFRERLDDYVKVEQDKDKVYVRLIFSVMWTLMALHYTDEMTMKWNGRQVASDEIADNLQNLSEFDYDEMELDRLGFTLEFNRLFFGKAFLVYEWRDKIKQTPRYRPMSPLSWLPDMNPDPVYWPRFHQFELELDSNYITKERGFYNVNKLQVAINDELEETKNKYGQVRQLNYTRPDQTLWHMIPVHYCFTTMWGKKYYVVTALNHKVVLKMEEIPAVFEEEKKNPDNITRRSIVVERDFYPVEWDPFGLCIPDILADKQRAMQLLMWLEKTKAIYQAYGSDYLYDPDKVSINDITHQDDWPRYIPIKKGTLLDQNLANALQEIPRQRIDGDVFSMMSQIKQQAQSDIGLDERSLGIWGDKNITATENQRIQKNANLKQVLQTRIKQRWRKDFWRSRYRAYYENFKRNSVKSITVNKRFGQIPLTIRKKDIITGYDIDVQITHKSDLEAQRNEQRLYFMSTAQLILQDPNKPQLVKDMVMRKALQIFGNTKEEAYEFVPPSRDEMQAQEDVLMINSWLLPDIPDPQSDLMTYLIIYQRAIPNRTKDAAIEAIKELLRQFPPQPTPPIQWQALSQLANMQWQEQTQWASSLSDVWPNA